MAVLVTVRHSDHKNASCSCVGVAGVIRVSASCEAVQRSLPGLGVHPAVVDGLHPRGEQPVQLDQVGHLVGGEVGGDLDKELLAHRPEDTFSIFPRPAGWPGLECTSRMPKLGAGAQQLLYRPWRCRCRGGGRPGSRGRPGRCAAPPPTARCPRDAPTDIRSAAREWSSRNAKSRALRPSMSGPCSASPVHRSFGAAASNRPNAFGGVPSGRVFSSSWTKCRCRVRSFGAHPECARRIAATCTRRACRVLPLQRRRQIQYLGRGAWRHPPRRGNQRIEPAAPPGPDPPVDRSPATPAPESRTGPHARRRPAPAPAGRVAWSIAALVGGFPDQAVTEQPHRRGPLSPDLFFPVMACLGHRRLLALVSDTRVAKVVDQRAVPKGQLVLIDSLRSVGASSRPPVTAEATCQADTAPTTPSRRRAADTAAASAATASANAETAGVTSPVNGSSSTSGPVHTARTCSAFRANARSQPRTVEAARPNRAATSR